MNNKLRDVLKDYDAALPAIKKNSDKLKAKDKEAMIFVASFKTLLRTVIRPTMNRLTSEIRKHNHLAFKSAYNGGRYLSFEKEGYRITLRKEKKYFHLLFAGDHHKKKVYVYKRIVFDDMTEEKEVVYNLKDITEILIESMVIDGMKKILKTKTPALRVIRSLAANG